MRRGNTTFSLWNYKLRLPYYIVIDFIGNYPSASVTQPRRDIISLKFLFYFSLESLLIFRLPFVMVEECVTMDSTFGLWRGYAPALCFVFGVATGGKWQGAQLSPSSPLCYSITSCNFAANICSATQQPVTVLQTSGEHLQYVGIGIHLQSIGRKCITALI